MIISRKQIGSRKRNHHRLRQGLGCGGRCSRASLHGELRVDGENYDGVNDGENEEEEGAHEK